MPSADVVAPPQSAASTLNVTSETNLLQQVIVHTPGYEMELVSPDNRVDLLFDDILFLGNARREHLTMCSVFEKVVGRDDVVLQLSELLLDVFQKEAARFDFVERLCRSLPEKNLRTIEDELKRLSPDALHRFALTGETDLPVTMQPIPNLMFTRDLAAVVHDRIILSHAATAARTRESIIINVVLTYHDRFEGLQDQIIRLPEGVTFEGGDLLMASERVVLIGHSERTSFGAIMAIARDLFGQTPVEHVLAVELPKKRSCMHLDTVLTFSAPDECILFPPLVEDPGFSYAVHFMPGSEPGRFVTDMRPHLQDALQDLTRRDLTFIPCGGGERIHQQREQWTDGANVFAAAPEAVIGYDRNQRTFEQMRNHGYHVVSADNFLSYYENSTFKPGEDRVAIQLTGTELSRGRGGPRCMTLPIARSAAPGGHAASDDA